LFLEKLNSILKIIYFVLKKVVLMKGLKNKVKKFICIIVHSKIYNNVSDCVFRNTYFWEIKLEIQFLWGDAWIYEGAEYNRPWKVTEVGSKMLATTQFTLAFFNKNIKILNYMCKAFLVWKTQDIFGFKNLLLIINSVKEF